VKPGPNSDCGWWPPGAGEPGSDWTFEQACLRLSSTARMSRDGMCCLQTRSSARWYAQTRSTRAQNGALMVPRSAVGRHGLLIPGRGREEIAAAGRDDPHVLGLNPTSWRLMASWPCRPSGRWAKPGCPSARSGSCPKHAGGALLRALRLARGRRREARRGRRTPARGDPLQQAVAT
jgi:hypothetical protein